MSIINEIYVPLFVLYFIGVCLFTCNSMHSGNMGHRNGDYIFKILLLMGLGILIAVRPLNLVPDAQAYYNRYMTGPFYNSYDSILRSESWYRGCLNYSMSRPVNLLFYTFYQLHVPYTVFIFFVVTAENIVYYHYLRKICVTLNIKVDYYLLILMTLFFYTYPYQMIAFAQGIGMCFSMPILYFLINKKYLKMLAFVGIAMSIHISAVYFLAIIVLYFIPKLKDSIYIVLWTVVMVLYTTGFGFDMGGDGIANLVQKVLAVITSHSFIYASHTGYVEGEGMVALAVVARLIFLGCIIFVWNDKREYWKLININLISIFLMTLFGNWDIVHRFTDISAIYIPVIVLIYIYEARQRFRIEVVNIKRVINSGFTFVYFMSMLSRLGIGM